MWCSDTNNYLVVPANGFNNFYFWKGKKLIASRIYGVSYLFSNHFNKEVNRITLVKLSLNKKLSSILNLLGPRAIEGVSIKFFLSKLQQTLSHLSFKALLQWHAHQKLHQFHHIEMIRPFKFLKPQSQSRTKCLSHLLDTVPKGLSGVTVGWGGLGIWFRNPGNTAGAAMYVCRWNSSGSKGKQPEKCKKQNNWKPKKKSRKCH